MPRVTMFQSVVDSTVTAAEVVRGLLADLPGAGNELVVFDVNRYEQLDMFVAPGPLESLERLRNEPTLPFQLTVIANRGPATREIAAFVRKPGAPGYDQQDLAGERPFNIGAVAARGENGALVVSLAQFSRLRSNPFFDVIRSKVRETLAVYAAGGAPLLQ
jgi:hypothetical protein